MSGALNLGIGIPGGRRRGAVTITYNPAPHRYWRVRLFFYNGANAGLAEVEFRLTAGGASQTGGTAIASGSFSGSFLPANAFDANLATLWAAATAGGGEWVGMDYGAGNAKLINQVALTSRNDVAQWPDICVVDSSDDGASWSVEWGIHLTGFTAAGQQKVFTRPVQTPALHNSWRLRATANNGSPNLAVGLLLLRATAGQAHGDSAGGTAISSGDFSPTFSADKAFNNTLSSNWAEPTNVGWVGYTGGRPLAVNEIKLYAGDGASGFVVGQMPKDFAIEWSDDGGASWTPEWTVTGATAWALGESRTYTHP